MATRLYSTPPGSVAPTAAGTSFANVTEAAGSAVTTYGIEATIDLAQVTTKEQALLGLQRIIEHITRGNWPPA